MMLLGSIFNTLLMLTISFSVAILPVNMILATTDVNSIHDRSILEVMRSIPHFSLMVFLIERAQQEKRFEDESAKTMVLVPTDDAFLNSSTDLIVRFLTDRSWKLHLLHFLKYHVLHDIADIKGDSKIIIETMVDETVTLGSSLYNGIIVNSIAEFVEESIVGSNGAIQAINNALIPSWHDSNIGDLLELDPRSFSILNSIGKKNFNFRVAISSSSWEPYTLFAPTNEAFSASKIFEEIDIADIPNFLCYHLVPGIHTGVDLMHVTYLKSSAGHLLEVNADPVQRTLRINGRLVIRSNILANNGVVHIIDGPLIPSLNESNQMSFRYPEDIQTEVQKAKRNMNLTERRCGCSSCPVLCGAWIEWLKNNKGYDESSACSELTKKSSTLNCEQCIPGKCSSITDLKKEAYFRFEEYNKCLFWKETEESRGASEVKCSCLKQELGDDIFIELKCNGKNNTTCGPKYAGCDTSESCCSNPLRRCVGGQCRDVQQRPRRRKTTM